MRRWLAQHRAELIVVLVFVAFACSIIAIGTHFARTGSAESASTPSATSTLAESSNVDDFGEGDGGQCARDVSVLQNLSKKLVEAWGRLEPADTTKDRRERLASMVTEQFFTSQNVEVYGDLPAEQARRRSGLTSFAIATGSIDVICGDNGDTDAATELAIVKAKQDQAGAVRGAKVATTASIHWRREGQSWKATSLEETQP